MNNFTKKLSLSLLYRNLLISKKENHFNNKNYNFLNCLTKEEESFKINSNTTYFNTNKIQNNNNNNNTSKNLSKDKSIIPKLFKTINTDFNKIRYKKIYSIKNSHMIKNLKVKSKYIPKRNNFNEFSGNSSYYKLKNKTNSPKSILDLFSESNKNNNSSSFKKKTYTNPFKFNTMETKESEKTIPKNNKCLSSYKKQMRINFLFGNYHNHLKDSNTQCLNNLCKNIYQKKNNVTEKKIFTKKSDNINKTTQKKNKFKKIDMKKIYSTINENIRIRRNPTKISKINLKKNIYDIKSLRKIKNEKNDNNSICNKNIKKNINIPYDIFINNKSKKRKISNNKILKTINTYKNKENIIYSKLYKEKVLLKKHKTNLSKKIEKNKIIFDIKNFKNKLELNAKKDKPKDAVNNSENFVKKFLEVFISLTPNKMDIEKKENENELIYDENSKKKLNSLLCEVKKIEKDKKKKFLEKKLKEESIEYISLYKDRDLSKIINNNLCENSTDYINNILKRKIELIDEESNIRMNTYNKYFEFIFDILNQINKLSKNVDTNKEIQKKEDKKIETNIAQNFVEEDNLSKNKKSQENMIPISDTSSFFVSSISDDFYKKLLDITRNILDSTTIQINDFYYENMNNNGTNENNNINISLNKYKTNNLLTTHPNEILNKLKFEYKKENKKNKNNTNLFPSQNNSSEKTEKNDLNINNENNNIFNNINMDTNSNKNCLII